MADKRNLKAAIEAGAVGVAIYCVSCSVRREFTADHALELWGTDATFPEIARRSKCKTCGQQASDSAPEWPMKNGSLGRPEGWKDLSTANPARFPAKRS